MRRKYGDCQRKDGNCTICSLVSYGRDCHNNPITHLELARRSAGLTQKQLADDAEVSITLIQKIESGVVEASNVTAKNLLAIADALGEDPRRLI